MQCRLRGLPLAWLATSFPPNLQMLQLLLLWLNCWHVMHPSSFRTGEIMFSGRPCERPESLWTRYFLTLSPPIPLRLYILPYWSNPLFFNFWHSGALALRTERRSARMSKIKNSGLDQYGAEPLEQQQFGTAGVEGVKSAWGINSPN